MENKSGRIPRVKRCKTALAILALLSATFALADDFKTINGKEYKNAKVTRVEPDGIVITFSGGIAKIPFIELSAEIQKKYGYDLGTEAAYAAKQREQQATALGTEPHFAGEYADKNFLNGQAVFQMSLEQSGNDVSVWFSTGYNDGHGCSPEATGTGKVSAKGIVEFTFRDTSKNFGRGRIARAGDGIVVSFKTTHISDAQCVKLYGQKIRLEGSRKDEKEQQSATPRAEREL